MGRIAMPGIDYAKLRAMIGVARVLELIEFTATESSGDQLRGPCPMHHSSSPGSRSFSVNLTKNTFRCFKCGAQGNQLDLWLAITRMPLHEAAKDLCNRLGINPPLTRRR
jgi:DNA primase